MRLTGPMLQTIYRAVLRLAPHDVRVEYGAEMEALFAECCERERHRRTLWGGRLLCLKGLADLLDSRCAPDGISSRRDQSPIDG